MRCPRVPDAACPSSCALALLREGEGGRGAGLAGRSERVAHRPESVSAASQGRLSGGAGGGSMGAELELFWRRGKLASSCAEITFSNSYSFMIVDFYWALFLAIVETVL